MRRRACNPFTCALFQALLNNKKNIKKGRAYNILRPWLGRGLLTSNSHRWLTHRRLITPTFHFSILENFLAVFEEHAHILVNCFQPFADRGSPVDIGQYVTRCTLDVISGNENLYLLFHLLFYTKRLRWVSKSMLKYTIKIAQITTKKHPST